MQCVLRGDAALMYHMLRLLHEMKPLLWLTTGFCSDCRMDLCAAVVQCDACCALVDCMLGDRATLRACGKKRGVCSSAGAAVGISWVCCVELVKWQASSAFCHKHPIINYDDCCNGASGHIQNQRTIHT
jgi:hypothetical protein